MGKINIYLGDFFKCSCPEIEVTKGVFDRYSTNLQCVVTVGVVQPPAPLTRAEGWPHFVPELVHLTEEHKGPPVT